MLEINKIYHGDNLEILPLIDDNSIDLIATDPPYQLSATSRPRPDQTSDGSYGKEVPFSRQQSRIKGFMGKEWDVLPKVEVWKECLRILKPGSFAFIMCTPRQDSLLEMLFRIREAGFLIGFTSLYWTFASGFPKAQNIGKIVDKRRWGSKINEIRNYLKQVIDKSNISHKKIKEYLGYDYKSGVVSNWTITDSGASIPSSSDWLKLKKILSIDDRYDNLILEVEREVISRQPMTIGIGGNSPRMGSEKVIDVPATPQAKALNGSFGGYQPKPAVEIIIVAMKPLSEKTYVDQALKDSKGITWLDDCRIPYDGSEDKRTWEGWRDTQDSLGHENNLYKGGYKEGYIPESSLKGRFPANLLCGTRIDYNLDVLLELQKELKGESGSIPKP